MNEEKEEPLFDEAIEGPEPEVVEEPKEPGDESVAEQEAPAEQPEGTVDVLPKQPEPGFVPFAAVLDERDKRKALEQQLEQFRAQQKPAESPQPPDMFEDPEGWQTFQQQQFQSALYGQRLDMSHRFAVQQHGEETVRAAMEWGQQRCASDPHFNAMVASQADPVGFAVQQFQRDQIASKVDLTEYEQFQAWKAAQAQLQPGDQQQQPQPKPPKSIAAAPSAGGVQHIALGEEAAFAEEFK